MTAHRICMPLGRNLAFAQLVEAWRRACAALDQHEHVLAGRHPDRYGPGTDALTACRGGLCLVRALAAVRPEDIPADAGDRPCAVAASAGGPVTASALPQRDGAAGKDARLDAWEDAPGCSVSPHRDAAGFPVFVDGRAA